MCEIVRECDGCSNNFVLVKMSSVHIFVNGGFVKYRFRGDFSLMLGVSSGFPLAIYSRMIRNIENHSFPT